MARLACLQLQIAAAFIIDTSSAIPQPISLQPCISTECKLSPTPDSGKKAVAEAGDIMVKLGTRDNWALLLMHAMRFIWPVCWWIAPQNFREGDLK